MKVRSWSRRRVIRSVSAVVFVVIAALAFVGCFGPTFVVQQYGGPERPRETIATLRVDAKEPTRLLFLDDQDVAAPLADDARLHIEVLPGRHTVVVGNASAPNERYAPMTFEGAAGKVYRVVFPSGSTGEARVFEVGRGDNALVRDVTDVEKPKEAPARAAPPPVPTGTDGTPAVDSAADAGTTDGG